ncbi:MAG: biotin/lipoyl-binding protein, partial [Chitinophagaceae bacterium]|nr:biotin/lipoyl-binding protein [Chitinophagaceae bacterium]
MNAGGKICPEIEVKIGPDVTGRITGLYVQEGDGVHKGPTLARVDYDIYACSVMKQLPLSKPDCSHCLTMAKPPWKLSGIHSTR